MDNLLLGTRIQSLSGTLGDNGVMSIGRDAVARLLDDIARLFSRHVWAPVFFSSSVVKKKNNDWDGYG